MNQTPPQLLNNQKKNCHNVYLWPQYSHLYCLGITDFAPSKHDSYRWSRFHSCDAQTQFGCFRTNITWSNHSDDPLEPWLIKKPHDVTQRVEMYTHLGFRRSETGMSPFWLFSSSPGTMLLPSLTFWGLNALLLVVDTTGKPSFITRYRIQLDKNNPVCETPDRFWASRPVRIVKD